MSILLSGIQAGNYVQMDWISLSTPSVKVTPFSAVSPSAPSSSHGDTQHLYSLWHDLQVIHNHKANDILSLWCRWSGGGDMPGNTGAISPSTSQASLEIPEPWN